MADQSSTYFVQDRSNEQEIARLVAQDRMVTEAMGGVLAEQPPARHFERILDVGCGTGGWLIQVAQTYPDATMLIGIDISKTMLDYAHAQAEERGLGPRIEFHCMDALRMLEFPDRYFDLVNMRFAFSFLRTWDWPKMMQELVRVCKPGGIVRITDTFTNKGSSSSQALSRLGEILVQAFVQAGHAFPESLDVKLPQIMQQYGLQDVQKVLFEPEYTANSIEGQLYIEDITRIFRTALPFVRKWAAPSEDFEAMYQQMLHDFQQPDFKTVWPLFTCWGRRP